MKCIGIGNTYYALHNIVKVRKRDADNTIGIVTVDGDTDWYDSPTAKEADDMLTMILKSLEDA